VPSDVQLSGKINKTIHFQGGPGSLAEMPVPGPDPFHFVIVEARDAKGTLVAFNFTQVEKGKSSVTIELNGFGMAGPTKYMWDSQLAPWHWYRPLLVDPIGTKWFLYRYRHIRDYGLMPGTYKIYVYVRGFVQQEWEWASVSLSGKTTYISNHMYLGAGINVTVWSIDWQHPKIARDWVNPGSYILIDVLRDEVNTGRVFYWDSTAIPGRGEWVEPKQTAGEVSVPYPGWKGSDPGTSYLKYNGSVILERTGPDETVGAWTPDPEDEATTLWWSTIYFGAGFLTSPGNYRDDNLSTKVALETGTYHFEVQSYGYAYKYPSKYDLYVAKGTQADTKLELVIGVNFTGQIIFKKEGIVSHLPYDAYVEVDIYDKDGNLVATASSGGDRGHYALGESNDRMSFWTMGIKDGDATSKGVDGYPNYDGEWTVKAWVAYTGRDIFHNVWYPPPPGLLLGWGGDGSPQGLGPYEMRTEVVIPNTPLSGTASIIFELDERALISGQVLAFSESNELRPVSWASVTAKGAEVTEKRCTFDGRYEMFLPRGEYELTITEWPGEAGHHSLVTSITAPDGGNVDFGALTLERSNIAIPEFPIALVPSLAALGASLYLLKRRKD